MGPDIHTEKTPATKRGAQHEWYKAAYYDPNKSGGPGYWDYPTGVDTPAPGRDMSELTNPGNNVNYYYIGCTFPIESLRYITAVGEFQLSDSPYGTFDQGGNIMEWTELRINWEGGTQACIRGGMCSGNYSYLFAAYPYYWPPEAGTSVVGFRVSEILPEPATTLLLGIGGAVVALRRRRAC